MSNPKTLINAAVALASQRCLSISYDGKPRLLEVHAIGASTKDGGTVIRGYQVDGESSRPLPCWALFRADDIFDAELTDDFSIAPRISEGYNPDGDKQMSEIFAKVAA